MERKLIQQIPEGHVDTPDYYYAAITCVNGGESKLEGYILIDKTQDKKKNNKQTRDSQ